MYVLFMFTFPTVNENSDIFVHINLYENFNFFKCNPQKYQHNSHYNFLLKIFNPIQDGGTKSFPPLTPVTSINVEISPQNFLTFSFNPFATMVQSFKTIPSASTKLLNLNPGHLQKS